MRHPNRKPSPAKNFGRATRHSQPKMKGDVVLLNGAQQAFHNLMPQLRDGKTEKAIQIINKLSRMPIPQARLAAADMAVEVAVKSPSSRDEKDRLLAKAHGLWLPIKKADQFLGGVSFFGVRAAVGINTLPTFRSIAQEGKLPNSKGTQAVYTELARTAQATATLAIDAYGRGNTHAGGNAIGLAAALAVNLLLLRHTSTSSDARNHTALPAFLSEEKFGLTGKSGHLRDTWNVSLFSDASSGSGFNLVRAIKVQSNVQNGETPESLQQRYSDRIACVTVGRHLAITGKTDDKGGAVIHNIINGAMSEVTGQGSTPETTAELDIRTEQLFGVITNPAISSPQITY